MENNNNYSSMKDQAKKGLSTFVLTLSISLIVFSTIYYLMTTKSSETEETTSPISALVTDEGAVEPEVQGDSSQTTIFGEIASRDPKDSYKQVLAGADEITDPTTTTVTQTSQSNSNLDTGVTSITFGLVFSLVLFVSTILFVSKNPRKLALSTFEKNTTKGL